jgi:hypothetical protein
MNPEDEHFESKLREFTPVEVPQALQSRILEIFETPETGRQPEDFADKVTAFPILRPLAVAAAVLVAATGVFFAVLNNLSTNPGTGPGTIAENPATKSFVPLRAENVFEGVDDEGLFLTGGKIPVHGVRYRFSDSFHWTNPKDGSVIKMTVPSERLYLIPVRTD